jgi:hypothetical protein
MVVKYVLNTVPGIVGNVVANPAKPIPNEVKLCAVNNANEVILCAVNNDVALKAPPLNTSAAPNAQCHHFSPVGSTYLKGLFKQ